MIFVPTNYVVVVVGYPRRRGARLAHCRGAAVLSHFSLIHLTAAAAWYTTGQPPAVCRDIGIGRCESHEDFIVESKLVSSKHGRGLGFQSPPPYTISELL